MQWRVGLSHGTAAVTSGKPRAPGMQERGALCPGPEAAVPHHRKTKAVANAILGLLAAWLGTAHIYDAKTLHKGKDTVKNLAGKEGLQLRKDARAMLALVPGAEDLLREEGDPKPGESEEPEVVT